MLFSCLRYIFIAYFYQNTIEPDTTGFQNYISRWLYYGFIYL